MFKVEGIRLKGVRPDVHVGPLKRQDIMQGSFK